MSQEQIVILSDFLNRQADLPVEVQAIADELKAQLNPAPVEAESVPEVATEPTPEESNG